MRALNLLQRIERSELSSAVIMGHKMIMLISTPPEASLDLPVKALKDNFAIPMLSPFQLLSKEVRSLALVDLEKNKC